MKVRQIEKIFYEFNEFFVQIKGKSTGEAGMAMILTTFFRTCLELHNYV